ncbi:MAG: hypothetical protein HWN67_18295 [Candidatus Helarchaeota archaeon]|nr:hypothetical protein [Candidatus Helarchaeota archaeon]
MKLDKIEIKVEQILPESLRKIGKEKYINELRLHPLLKWFWAAVAPAREEYQPYKVQEDIINDLLSPRVHYFLDPEKNTPKDPLYGRIKLNETIIFPNLWSWAKIAVCRLTEKESMLLKDISIKQLYDGFLASEQFFKIHYETGKDSKVYPSIGLNFLRPSASSIVHPHFQLVITPIPVPILGMYLEQSKNYFEKNQTNFFEDYIALEKKNRVRWLGEIGRGNNKVTFIVSYCPIAGRDEIFFIGPKSSFPLSDACWKNIAEGLFRVFSGYHEIGVCSINLNIISDLYNSESDYFRIFGTIWSRPLKNLDVSDRGFAEIGFKMALTYHLPEDVAKSLKKYWC